MNDTAVFALLSVPLVVFVSAGLVEFRLHRESLRRPMRLLPLILATILSILLLVPPELYFRYVSSPGVSLVMAMLALLVSASGIACRYQSRVTAALIVIGGLALAMLSMANKIVA